METEFLSILFIHIEVLLFISLDTHFRQSWIPFHRFLYIENWFRNKIHTYERHTLPSLLAQKYKTFEIDLNKLSYSNNLVSLSSLLIAPFSSF